MVDCRSSRSIEFAVAVAAQRIEQLKPNWVKYCLWACSMDLPNSSFVEDSDDTYQFETNAQLSENLISLSHQLDYVEYCFIKTLAEFDRRNAWKEPGAHG